MMMRRVRARHDVKDASMGAWVVGALAATSAAGHRLAWNKRRAQPIKHNLRCLRSTPCL